MRAQEKRIFAAFIWAVSLVLSGVSNLRAEEPINKASMSPNGLYKCVPIESGEGISDDELAGYNQAFKIVRVRDGKTALNAAMMSKLIGDGSGMYLKFGGWCGSDHIVVANWLHMSDLNARTRFGVNLRSGKLARFNDWLVPGGKHAIVPAQEMKSQDSMGGRTQEQDVYGSQGWKADSPNLYVATIPTNLADYRFASVSKKGIVYQGKPLHIILDHDFAFSIDGRYATAEAFLKRYAERTKYRIDLQTGEARRLSGGSDVTLSRDEWKKICVFFSNFAEAGVRPFSRGYMSDTAMIHFALMYLFINERSKAGGAVDILANGNFSIPLTRVENVCVYFLGRKPKNHQSIENGRFDGKNYVMRGGDGESYDFAQVTSLRRVAGNLYEANVNEYERPDIGWSQDTTPSGQWKPIEGPTKYPSIRQRMRGLIQKVAAPGKPRYVLLEYRRGGD